MLKDLFIEIDQAKQRVDAKRPLSARTLQSIRESLIVEWTYHSNAIEGNTLTLSETKVVLEGITIGGKTLREHLEAINHKEAILYMEEIIERKEPMAERHIKELHAIILKGIESTYAGAYRKENVLISGAEHIPPNYLDVPLQMENMMTWYRGGAQLMHPVERASILHSIFVKIHPFVDGNGRTARILVNLELMQAGYVPIVIPKEKRLDYYSALDKSHTVGDDTDFIVLIAKLLKERLEFYLRLI